MVLAKCMVLFCKSQGSIPGIKYFRLTSARHDSWMRALGRNPNIERLSEGNRVCSLHFAENDILRVNDQINIKPGAVPTLQLGIRKPLAPIHNILSITSENQFESIAASYDEEINDSEKPSTSYSNSGDSPSRSYKLEMVEEEINYDAFEVPLPDEEIQDPSSSISSSPSTVSADSIMVQSEVNSIIFCIYVLLGMFLISSCRETSGPMTKHLKRKLEQGSSSSDSEGYRGPIKKARKDIKLFHNYSKNPKSVTKKLDSITLKKEAFREKLKGCRRRVKKLSQKVTSLKQILVHLRKKNILEDEVISVLEKSYSGIPLSLLKRAMTNVKLAKKGKKQSPDQFPPELRSFALTLQFYSSKAYNYVRSAFNLALPAPSTLRSWVKNINCEPGFSDCSFSTLKRTVEENSRNNKRTICALMLDEMAIKKQIEVRGSRVWGYEEFGTEINNDSMKCATEALTLMVVAINGSWKIPVAYFLISSLGGVVKANIVREAIKRLSLIGVEIVSVTCDGPSAHFTMAENLGADIKDINNLKPFFNNPENNSRSFVLFDAAHMLKLIRNNWANLGIFIDGNGNEINFHYITKLAKVQEEEFCRLGTKLRKVHLQWRSHKMKVNLAAQTLSRSVADALEFLSDIHPEFKDVKPTIQFIRIVDELFDLANSRNPFGRGTKSPLQLANAEFWKPKIIEGMEYLKSLRNSQGELLSNTRNKTPIRGLCITLTSLIGLYDDLVNGQNSPLKYLLTYKFSQDHLELFFCCVRGRNGWNNNPTAYQFYYTYKRLVLNIDVKSTTGNCAVLDNTHILKTSSKHVIMPSLTTDDMSIIKKYNIDVNDMIVEEEDIQGVIQNLPSLSIISENVVAYVAGFVTKILKKSLKCIECLTFLNNPEEVPMDNMRLFNIKNRGGLIAPKNNIVNVCLYIEKKIRQTLLITNQVLPKENNFISVFNSEISMFLFENNYLSEIDNHLFVCSFGEEPHRMKMIKLLTKIYTRIRLYNVAKEQTQTIQGTQIRKTYSKLILFHHQ